MLIYKKISKGIENGKGALLYTEYHIRSKFIHNSWNTNKNDREKR